jgi:hypothetical protein
MDHLFYSLDSPLVFSDGLLRRSRLSSTTWTRNNDGFVVTQVPKEELDDRVLNALDDEFNVKFSIIKMMPGTMCNWHKDFRRTCVLNTQLNDVHSYAFFEEVPIKIHELVSSVVRIPYAPNRQVLMNTKWRHSVLNFDETRFVFTVSFFGPSYDDVLKFCVMNKL